MTPAELLAEIETRLLDERNRLAAEYAALEMAAAGQCAAAVLVTGLLPAFIAGFRRFCDLVDVAELQTRAATVATLIGTIETAVDRLPRLAELEDPARQAAALESMVRVVRAVQDVSAIGDTLDDVAEFVKRTVDDVKDTGTDLVTLALVGFGGALAFKALSR